MKAIVAPSILSADFSCLSAELKTVEAAEWVHIDVMDGHFVPNITLGPPIVKSLRSKSNAYFDVHAMVSEPMKWVEEFAKAGASGYTFHFEALGNDSGLVRKSCALVRSHGLKVGISLKPKTKVELIFPFIDDGLVDLVLIMSVEPGFGGQKFMPETMEKVKKLREKYPALDIEVDGGLNLETVQVAAEAGANVIVAGSAIFGVADRAATIREMQTAVEMKFH